jgi:hypothetical protein
MDNRIGDVMARTINIGKGTIKAKATESEDDVTVGYDRIKHVSSAATLFVFNGDDYWIPFSQIVDVYPGDNEALITSWIAKQKGIGQ